MQPNYFVMDRRNQKFVDGEAKRIGNSYIMWSIALVLLAIGVGSIIYFTMVIQRYETIQGAGNIVQATIEEARQTRSRRGSRNSRLTLNYVVSGESYTVTLQISNAFYNRVSEGMTIDLYFDKNDPSFVLPVRDSEAKDDLQIPRVLIPVFTVIPALLMMFMDYRNRKVSKGQMIAGELLAVNYGSAKGRQVRFEYGFYTPEGKLLKKKMLIGRPDLWKSKTLPTTGTPVIVLYLNERTFRGL